MSLTNEKTVFQGSFFYFPYIVGSANGLQRIISSHEHRASFNKNKNLTTLFLGLVLLTLVLFVPLATTYTTMTFDQKSSVTTYRETVSIISSRINKMMKTPGCIHSVYSIITTSPDPFPAEAVILPLISKGFSLRSDATYFSRTYEDLLSMIDGTDFILSPDPNMPGVGHHLPGLKYLAQFNAELTISSSFEHQKIETDSGYPLWLFTRSCDKN